MGFFTGVAKITLPFLLVVAIFSTHKLSFENGAFDLIKAFSAAGKLPDGGELRRHWTGVTAIDNLLHGYVEFFWPDVDGVDPGSSLQTFHFIGQLEAIWILMVIESFRVGNVWRIVSFVTLWGLGIEFVAIAIAVPLYGLLHLLTSPTATDPRTMKLSARKASLLVHPAELRVLPWSLAIGHLVCIGMIYYCDTTTLEPFYLSKQFWILARLIHPILTAMVHLTLSIFSRSLDMDFASANERNRDVLRALQTLYSFGTFVAAVPHISTVAFILTSQFIPGMFSSQYQKAYNPYSVFWPVHFWEQPVQQVTSVTAGAAAFLRWDEIVSCTSILIWAVAINRQALSGEPKGSGFFMMVIKTILMFGVGGPAAAAISLIRERDQIVLDKVEVTEEKKTR